jgi:hypothetical protein
MVTVIRNLQMAKAVCAKRLSLTVIAATLFVRKSLVATVRIQASDTLNEVKLTVARNVKSLPMLGDEVQGEAPPGISC